MTFYHFYVLALYALLYAVQSRTIASNGTTTIPRQSSKQTACFNGGDKILLIGGHYTDDVISFDINTKAFHDYNGYNDLLFQNKDFTETYAQAWVQIDDNLYWIDTDGDGTHFLALTLSNIDEYISATSYVDLLADFPVYFGAGMNGPSFTSIDEYFIVSGGKFVDFNWVNQIFIYNISSGFWLPNNTAPQMPYGLIMHSSVVHPMNYRLYLLGGQGSVSSLDYKDAIITLDVSDMHDFNGKQFIQITPKLSVARYGVRSLVYGQYIFVIGGVYQGVGGMNGVHYYPKTIEIIDVLNNDAITADDELSFGVAFPSIIAVNSILYVFGGDDFETVYTPHYSTRWQYYSLPPTNEPTNAPTTPQPSHIPTSVTGTPSFVPTQTPTLFPSTHPATTQPTNQPSSVSTSPSSFPSNHPASVSNPATAGPASNPSFTTPAPTIGPTLQPTYGTSTPTGNPSYTVPPTKSPHSVSPTENTASTSSALKDFTSTYTPPTQERDTSDSISLDPSKPLFYVLVVVSLCATGLSIACIVYLLCISKISERTKQLGTGTIKGTLKEYGIFEKISLLIEVFDATTDYLFALDLITSTDTVLGWISLLAAIVGCVIFYIKFFLSKKLIGFQTVRLRKEFVKRGTDESERIALMNGIRQRRMDIAMVGLLISCFEDCPQTIIVILVVTSDIGWSAFSLLSLTLSILSFLIKISQVGMYKYGCSDPDDLYDTEAHGNDHELEKQIEMGTADT
eukprot:81545_1